MGICAAAFQNRRQAQLTRAQPRPVSHCTRHCPCICFVSCILVNFTLYNVEHAYRCILYCIEFQEHRRVRYSYRCNMIEVESLACGKHSCGDERIQQACMRACACAVYSCNDWLVVMCVGMTTMQHCLSHGRAYACMHTVYTCVHTCVCLLQALA